MDHAALLSCLGNSGLHHCVENRIASGFKSLSLAVCMNLRISCESSITAVVAFRTWILLETLEILFRMKGPIVIEKCKSPFL